jgi:hypothetical protein
MASPLAWRNGALLVAVTGAAAVALASFADPALLGVDTQIGFGVFGVLALAVGAIVAAMKQAELRMRARLARGEDVLARWRVDPDTWQRFVEDDARRGDAADAWPNELRLPDTVPPDGMPVIVGRGAVQVGDSLHTVPERGTPEVLSATLDDTLRLATIELRLHYPGGAEHASMSTRLRFPVADGSLGAARAVVAHFARETAGRPDFFHGRGDGSDPEDLSRCLACGFQTHQYRSACPKCGAGLLSRRWSRRTGVVLMILGGGLAAGMGWLTAWSARMLLNPGVDYGGSRFTGTPAQAWTVLAIFVAVTAFGALAFSTGLYQLVTGSRSRRAIHAIVALAAFAFGLGLLATR